LATALLEDAPAKGWVVSLIGPLGSGKTEFAKGLAAGLGLAEREVTSPTFVLANEWNLSRGRFVHADWYRVESAADLEAAGLDDWLEPGTGLLVEWGDRFPASLPADHLQIVFAEGDEPSARELSADPGGAWSRGILERWEALVPAVGH